MNMENSREPSTESWTTSLWEEQLIKHHPSAHILTTIAEVRHNQTDRTSRKTELARTELGTKYVVINAVK
jgi:hypothetical protein